MSNEPIKVFISYSWDSKEHKAWVAKLATSLQSQGISVILDQWDTDFGDDLATFMERSVIDSDRVLLICTDEYVRKADGGKGGVAYEKMIVTTELVNNVGSKKFVPIIRHGTGEQVTPAFLGVRKYADFRQDETYDADITELVESLKKTGSVKDKPQLQPVPKTAIAATIDIEANIAERGPVEVYKIALSLVQAQDMIEWRKFVQKMKASFKPALLNWRVKYDAAPPQQFDKLRLAVDEAIEAIAPTIMAALAGIESQNPKFTDQRALFDEFLHPHDWNQAGFRVLANLPHALGLVYQALHGAVCMHTSQPETALNLAMMSVQFSQSHETRSPLWKNHELVGWCGTIGDSCIDNWAYLAGAFEKWPWLSEIFGTVEEYKISLISYYMLLNFVEFSQKLSAMRKKFAGNSDLMLDVPILYSVEDHRLCDRALSRITKHSAIFDKILVDWKITHEEAKENWPHWITVCNNWLSKIGYWAARVPAFDLTSDFRW